MKKSFSFFDDHSLYPNIPTACCFQGDFSPTGMDALFL